MSKEIYIYTVYLKVLYVYSTLLTNRHGWCLQNGYRCQCLYKHVSCVYTNDI